MEAHETARLNELARKAKETELTPDEKAEQKALREKFLVGFRRNLQAQLDNIYIVDEDGTEHKLQKKKK